MRVKQRAAVFMCALLLAACSGATPPGGSPGTPTATGGPTGSAGPTASTGATPSGPAGTAGPGATGSLAPTPTLGEGWHVGGTVSGLEGSGLLLYNLGEQLPVSQNGAFVFPQPLPDGAIYRLWVVDQPSEPDQGCTVTNGNGTVSGADVTDVTIECVTVALSPYLDGTFGAAGKVMTGMVSAQAEGVAIDSEGRILVAGRGADAGSNDFVLARYNPDGSLDTSFGSGGIVSTDLSDGGWDEAFDVAIAADQKIVVVGNADQSTGDDFGVVRYMPDGALDASFGGDGIVTTDFSAGADRAFAVVIAGDTVIVAGHAGKGTNNDFALARYTATGDLDPAFDGDGKVTTNIAGDGDLASAMALSPTEDKIVVVGRVAIDGTTSPDFGVVRYLLDGTPDPSFSEDGIVQTDFNSGSDDTANGVAILADGSVIAGGFSIGATSFDFALAKYDASGELDTDFGNGGLALADFGPGGQDYGQALALGQADTIVVVGNTQYDPYDMALARFTSAGVLDSTFGEGGLVTIDFHGSGETAQNVAVQLADGKAVAVGFAQNGSDTEFVVVRLAP